MPAPSGEKGQEAKGEDVKMEEIDKEVPRKQLPDRKKYLERETKRLRENP